MPLAIIAGMPNNKARQLKVRIDEKLTHQAWRFVWVPSRQNQAGLRTVWGNVRNIADAADEPGVHILAYHKRVSERGRYEKEIRFRHRLVWLDHSSLYSPVADEWWLHIEERLQLEESWREGVRPSNRRHALILPQGTFTSSSDPWTTAQRADTERTVARAHAAIAAFRERHRHHGRWTDDRGLAFEPGGAEHGQAPLDRRWKFTYRLSPGFHFDVSHLGGRRFTLVDAGGEQLIFREYSNVDAHGYVRGGK